MESTVHAAVPLRVGKKMRKRRELDALVGGGGARGGRLLSASSDEGEPWGRRASRRRRSRPFFRLAAALALCICVVSAATVLWLFVDVRRQIVSLRIEMDRVSTTSDSVGDALQCCHAAAKELRTNASNLTAHLAQLERGLTQLRLDYETLAKRVDKANGEFSELTVAAPKLVDTPRKLDTLEASVGSIGSQIKSLEQDVLTSKKQISDAVSGMGDVKTLLQRLETKSNETIANISADTTREAELVKQITALNATLVGKVEELERRLNQFVKPATTLAPSSTVSTTTTGLNSTNNTSMSNTTIAAAPLPTQGPHTKPNVLHTEGTK